MSAVEPGVVALSDDLTGATAVAAELHGAGLSVRVVRADAAREHVAAGALVADTGTRSAEPALAASAVTRTLRSVDPPSHGWFKRIDSGLRGNVGPELEAMSEALARPLVVAAAAPGLGIVTLDGTQRADGVPIGETHYADGHDGAAASSLTDALPGSVPVTLRDVRGPNLERTLARLAAAGRHAVCDSLTEADLARIGAVLARPALAGLAVPVGSYGLARHWGAGLAPARTGAPVLAAVSSVKARSLEQAEHAALGGARVTWAAHEADLDPARDDLRRGRDAVLLTAADAAAPAVTTPAAAEALAERVVELATSNLLAGLLLVGGDLATSFVRAARTAVEPLASPWPATAVATLCGGPLDGQVVIFKSGSRGGPGWLDHAAGVVRCIHRLREERHAG